MSNGDSHARACAIGCSDTGVEPVWRCRTASPAVIRALYPPLRPQHEPRETGKLQRIPGQEQEHMLGCKPDEPLTMKLDHPQHQRHKQPDTLLALPAEASGIHAQEAKDHQMFG